MRCHSPLTPRCWLAVAASACAVAVPLFLQLSLWPTPLRPAAARSLRSGVEVASDSAVVVCSPLTCACYLLLCADSSHRFCRSSLADSPRCSSQHGLECNSSGCSRRCRYCSSDRCRCCPDTQLPPSLILHFLRSRLSCHPTLSRSVLHSCPLV